MEAFDYGIKGLFATKVGAPDYEEAFITEGHDDKIRAASEWARANGFDRLRVVTVDGSVPDFTRAIN